MKDDEVQNATRSDGIIALINYRLPIFSFLSHFAVYKTPKNLNYMWNLGSIAGIVFLTRCSRAGNGWATAGVILYLFGMLMSYIASTTYHALSAYSKWKARLRKWDHSAIYWHIAGSYSPIALIVLREQGYWGWAIFIFLWACALVGTIISFIHLKDHSNLETICFVGMGMSVLVAFKPLIDSLSLT